MTLVLELPPELEKQVREAAKAEGMEISTFLREAAAARLRPTPPPRSMSETELLAKITERFPESFWSRYRALVAKRNAETLTREEQEELISFSDRTEARGAERLVYKCDHGRDPSSGGRARKLPLRILSQPGIACPG